MDYFNYKRRHSSEVKIGNTPLGGNNPIRIQSMTNTSTLDTEACVEQSIRIIDAGADYVRLTAQGVREAENLGNIRSALRHRGYPTPLVADIHFNPKAAEAAARIVEKVRINPGNFVDAARTFKKLEYTDEEYAEEIRRIRNKLVPFLQICREHNTTIRLGVNHGSLSDRIMSRYGDTPEGMVESCMEFLRICKEEAFDNIVISIKASNTVVMVKTVRLLVKAMDKENMHYPLHLGVTEAGDGEDGRIKSAVGIGTLLTDGIGDTIRVSLSEKPESEIPVARKLVEYISRRAGHSTISGEIFDTFDFTEPVKRTTHTVVDIGNGNIPVVVADISKEGSFEMRPDYIYTGKQKEIEITTDVKQIVDAEIYTGVPNTYPLFTKENIQNISGTKADIKFLLLRYDQYDSRITTLLQKNSDIVIIAESEHINPVGEIRALFHKLIRENITTPVIIRRSYQTNNTENLQIFGGADFGPLLLDYLGEGIWMQNKGEIPSDMLIRYMFGILQATRQRISKTEYISCPGCGRTLFDLQKTIARVKDATSHLKGLKIGIMGCIVNGPGEMADADYGYVGAARGKISLYKNKTCIEKNIPEENAVNKLIDLIKQNGDWTDRSE
ncbi:4-hydroxy-3-methylbut-2-en-1-yl diphosphate synthase [Coprobacter tertius]|uniref:4-hydroxy-3-methylbut-2-en-1-yl diphosphate synthase (flavodoxin) n=1 Tax=Coprobacter tertius TaxID=2944915 RepID=A0ABT1MFP1_9BACT|nr:4-hydroxy-3-methylbut-2-en-1-yl diphosphate synthase [Coprobacter tertius]MCP9610691.1 4-hydroxy-3-methylbut-2-en-1-yl diphosphate synthase [Coprobacter tertius]